MKLSDFATRSRRLLLSACCLALAACVRPHYTHLEGWSQASQAKQGLALGRIEVEGFEELSYLNPLRDPMGSPYLFLQWRGAGKRFLTHAQDQGYLAFPLPAGYFELEKLILLSPSASWIELSTSSPYRIQIQQGQLIYLGNLRFGIAPESREQASRLPQGFQSQRSQAQLKSVLSLSDQHQQLQTWLESHYPALAGQPLAPEANLRRQLQDSLLRRFLAQSEALTEGAGF